jgi:hypothetical protein
LNRPPDAFLTVPVTIDTMTIQFSEEELIAALRAESHGLRSRSCISAWQPAKPGQNRSPKDLSEGESSRA